jgi:hypothetical protein
LLKPACGTLQAGVDSDEPECIVEPAGVVRDLGNPEGLGLGVAEENGESNIVGHEVGKASYVKVVST